MSQDHGSVGSSPEGEPAFPPQGQGVATPLKETVVAAAVRIPVAESWRSVEWRGERAYPDFLTITAPPPARHATLMHPLWDHVLIHVPPAGQGFITSTGRYVEREEALQIALASGQPMIDHPSRHARLLFSEDLW